MPIAPRRRQGTVVSLFQGTGCSKS
jgi:hypothetical protein